MASETSSQQTRYDPWISQQQQGTAGTAYGLANNFWQASPFARAAQTADQLKAFDFARISTGNVFDAPRQNVLDLESARPLYTPQLSGSGKVTAGLISEQLNPFLSTVADSAINTMGRERDRTAAQIGARAAAGGSFGGSREAIQRGQLDRNFGEQVGALVPQIMSQGYDKASQIALANEGMAQQMAGKNMDAINSMRLSALDYGLKSPQVQSQLDTQRQARELQGAQAVLGAGNQQQQFAQSAMDVPRTMLDWYRNYVPQVYNQDVFKQTEKEDTNSFGQQLLGAGVSLLGSYLKSDENTKTNIKKLGKDESTGLVMFEYDYKEDVGKGLPKRVSPMAQDVEKTYPGTTKKVGKTLVIDPGLLSEAIRNATKKAA